jgi:hypothetical protein
MARSGLFAWIAIPLLLAGGMVHAADDETARLREQLRATVLQLRELQDAQAAAAARPTAPTATAEPGSAKLKARLSADEGELKRVRRTAEDAAAARASLDKTKADYDALAAKAAADEAELDKFKAAFSQASDTARAAATERDQLQGALATQTLIASACQAKNTRLIAFAEALIDTSNRITFGQKLAARDPVLGLTRVRLENLAQEREDTVRGAKCDPRLDARPPPIPAKPPSAG